MLDAFLQVQAGAVGVEARLPQLADFEIGQPVDELCHATNSSAKPTNLPTK